MLPSHESQQPVAVTYHGNTTDLIQTPTDPIESAPTSVSPQQSRSRAICRFYHTAKGCRAGDQCQYRHVDRPPAEVNPEPQSQSPDTNANASEPSIPHRPRPARPRQVVQKPVPALQQTNPREFQLGQVLKRFSPRREDAENSTILTFKLEPSDPDFPFELKGGLQCTLTVPGEYPRSGVGLVLRIGNREMPRGYQINVEQGFASLVQRSPKKTLLALLNDLDRNLEQFLTTEKAQTLKISANAPARPTAVEAEAAQGHREPADPPPSRPAPLPLPLPVYTVQQKTAARSKREADVRQLEARMSRLPLYSKSQDGTIYTIPMQVPKASRLPVSLQAVKEAVLFVPPLYNLEPCTVHIKDVESQESQNVEIAFEKHARAQSGMTLMAHVNYLAVNMHTMATEAVVVPDTKPVEKPTPAPAPTTIESREHETEQLLDSERPHLKVIPRPPEWDQPDGESDESSSEEYTDSEDYSESEEGETEGGATLPATNTTSTSDKGIAISFPDIELYGIELFEITSLALTLKCDRCKTNIDMANLKPSSNTTLTVTQVCPKCAYEVAASFHPMPVHAHNVRAGHLDLTACTVVDMLPSIFAPTCSDCSTPFPAPGVTSVRGETTLVICRTCHHKMTFKLPSVKFLRVSTAANASHPLLPRRKPPREKLGITTGTPLPDTGRCTHYRKSLRWFRFSCCGKVYPCDRCHDEQSSPKHANEHANRMICGYCSREQNYRPEDCGTCGRGLVGKKGGGFWEGGKGTRDRMKMSRKEPRKFKRLGGGAKNKAKENR